MTGIAFADLSEADKARLLEEYNTSRPKIAALRSYDFDSDPYIIRRQLQRWAKGGRGADATPVLSIMGYTLSDEESAALADWTRYLNGLKQKQRHVTVAHISDLHYPFHDRRAEALVYKTIAHVQPGIIVVGSDALDFHLLSKFSIDPDLNDLDDELDRAEYYWNPHIQALNKAAPDARIVAIMGNHEKRLITEIENNSPYTRKTVWRRFVDIMKCGERVTWLGNRDRVEVGDWVIQHGRRSTKYPANQVLEDLGFQRSSLFGHAHRLSYSSKRGADKTVHAVGAGCLCDLHPHWRKGTELNRLWQQGFAFADIALRGTASGYHNLEFTPDGSGALETRIGFTSIIS